MVTKAFVLVVGLVLAVLALCVAVIAVDLWRGASLYDGFDDLVEEAYGHAQTAAAIAASLFVAALALFWAVIWSR